MTAVFGHRDRIRGRATDVDEILSPDSNTVTKGAVKPINGTPAIALTEGDADGTLYVATTGEPYPLKLEGAKPEDGGMDFTEFGSTFADIQAPAAADTIDFSKIGA